MKPVVIDASLAAAFILRVAHGQKLDDILLDAARGDLVLYAPPLLSYEMINIFVIAERQRRITMEQANDARYEFNMLPIQFDDAPAISVRERIHALARRHAITAYDACYLELGQRMKARLMTLDRDLLKLRPQYSWIA